MGITLLEFISAATIVALCLWLGKIVAPLVKEFFKDLFS